MRNYLYPTTTNLLAVKPASDAEHSVFLLIPMLLLLSFQSNLSIHGGVTYTEHSHTWAAAENGALDVNKDFCYSIPLSLTIMTKKIEPIRLALEKIMQMMLLLKNPANFPWSISMYWNIFSILCRTLWLGNLTQSFIKDSR